MMMIAEYTERNCTEKTKSRKISYSVLDLSSLPSVVVALDVLSSARNVVN